MKTERTWKALAGSVSSFALTVFRWHRHALVYGVLLLFLLFSAVVLTLRYWVLPDIAKYRESIATSISQAAGQRVTIGKIEAGWEGLRPHFVLRDVQVFDKQGRPALYLSQIENTLSWWTLFLGEARFHSLEINQPSLAVRRDVDGLIYVAGVVVNQSDAESGFADWMLKQNEITVRNAVILWQDNQRNAPPLVLTKVSLKLENHGARHLFGIQASPPSVLAKPLDVRGDVTGKSLNDLNRWKGTLYARLDYANIEGWRQWLTYPVDLQYGIGSVQFWLGFASKQVNELTLDTHLKNVRTQFAADLPILNLKELQGRLGWKSIQNGQVFTSNKLKLSMQDGLSLGPAAFTATFKMATVKAPAEGEVKAENIALKPLLALSEYVPVDRDERRKLLELSPQGSFPEFSLKWRGDWNSPKTYNVKGQFANVGINSYQDLPGFSGLSGNLDANENGGALSLNSHRAKVELVKVFREPIPFDTLTAQINWKIKQKNLEVKLANVSFANAHLAGSAYGRYQSKTGSPGEIDLTGNLNRADARYVGRYIPLIVGQSARDWLDTAFLAGFSNDVHVRLKGDLADFPFVDDKKGIFQVRAKVNGGGLEYVSGWPIIENISGDLLFQGKRMEVNVSKASIFGVGLQKVKVQIPDLLVFDEMLLVEGQAQGSADDFIRYVNQSPVSDMIGGFSSGVKMSGNGKLALKLQVPLRHTIDTKISGTYQFMNDTVQFSQDAPTLEKVNGTLAFTEANIKIPNVSAQAFGLPMSVQANTQPDKTIRIVAQGKLSGEGLRKYTTNPLAKYVNGTTDWRGLITMKNQQADIVVESALKGLALDLPPPFTKAAASVVPLRVTKKITSAQEDLISLNYGKVLSAKLMLKRDGDKASIDSGALTFGGSEAKLTGDGVWATGTLPYLNLDQWRNIFAQIPAQTGREPLIDLSGMNLSVDTLDIFNKRFNAFHMNAWKMGDSWQATLASNEMNGEVNWNSREKGRVYARLKNLSIPDSISTQPDSKLATTTYKELPALDIIAESLEIKRRKLGKLEVLAVQQGNDWKIENLKLTNPDMVLKMSGLWEAWLAQPNTQAKINLEVKDVGKFLARFGYPDSVKRGTAKLDGQLSWAGSPSELDYSSMSGNFILDASNGQFLKIEPGFGKLLGILSLQALPRRITLDFRDVFSEGFAFDNISGSMKIERGVLNSDDFTIEGPAATVKMSGETDLAHETQKLLVKVTPAVGEGVSVAGAFLGGPVVGLTTLLLQKVLKNPLGQLISYQYSITGTWNDPIVAKVKRETAVTTE
ncbi:YhdP family protein [Sulfurirhabdus autotrophica]|uniref:Uncharacterized protein (TIGR02099 family) n=1 Tax=Sulfurirhabdus autotrophica TaxID=1706046 RepID=A0A4R3Y5F5_9PROT|nr:YhdP family protein [Sulfurirhabdus autotrophica]TCV85393.1 uncharacterized protein (TIGR02099 family) [Sulfurirhabdus autotrophica]